jgi:hypothetical protein
MEILKTVDTVNQWPAITLAVSCCIFLALIDFYYAGKKAISPVYIVDGILELIMLIPWIFYANTIR